MCECANALTARRRSPVTGASAQVAKPARPVRRAMALRLREAASAEQGMRPEL
jgi:hypothetical protein